MLAILTVRKMVINIGGPFKNQYEKKSNNKRFMGGKYTSKENRLVFMLVGIVTGFYSTSIAQSASLYIGVEGGEFAPSGQD